ncbi:hypothetical protein HNY73_014961 [Argiope bruennichi]|uniref:Uncharacterized protein n=1 Tax=Argiope bruennichi TaxID=94029 RepID=A0A8T0EW13_ARGBR|nr:hypothetical protein HNY73_014961 [Argiope bruennichi]
MKRLGRPNGWWAFFLLVPLTVLWVCCMCFFLGRLPVRPKNLQLIVNNPKEDEELYKQASTDLEKFVSESAGRVRIRRILENLAGGLTEEMEHSSWIVMPKLDPSMGDRKRPKRSYCKDPPLCASVDIVTRNYVSNADPSLDQGIYLLSNATAELLNKRISIATVNAVTPRSQKKGENAKGDGNARRIESGTGGHQYKAPNNVMNNIVADSASLRSATRSPTIDVSTNRNMFNVSTAVSTAINSTPVIAVPPMSTTGVIGKHGQPQGSALPTNRMTATSGKTSQYPVPQPQQAYFQFGQQKFNHLQSNPIRAPQMLFPNVVRNAPHQQIPTVALAAAAF